MNSTILPYKNAVVYENTMSKEKVIGKSRDCSEEMSVRYREN